MSLVMVDEINDDEFGSEIGGDWVCDGGVIGGNGGLVVGVKEDKKMCE